jgi:hypothetical protein
MWGCVSPLTTSGRSHRVLVTLPGIALFSQPSLPHLVFISVCYLTHACPCRLLNSCRVINNQVCFQAKEVRAPCTVRLFRTQRPILHLLIMWALSMWCDAGVHRVRGGLPSDMQQSALHSEGRQVVFLIAGALRGCPWLSPDVSHAIFPVQANLSAQGHQSH